MFRPMDYDDNRCWYARRDTLMRGPIPSRNHVRNPYRWWPRYAHLRHH